MPDRAATTKTLLRTKKADLAITSNPFYDMEGLERHAVSCRRHSCWCCRQNYRGPTDSLSAVQSRLPLIRFADSTSVGRQMTQHLRRLRLKPQQVIQADRSSMVTACVCHGMGFTLLTPIAADRWLCRAHADAGGALARGTADPHHHRSVARAASSAASRPMWRSSRAASWWSRSGHRWAMSASPR